MAWESPRNVLASSAKASEFRITLGSCWCAWRVQKRLEKGERRVKKKSGNIDKIEAKGQGCRALRLAAKIAGLTKARNALKEERESIKRCAMRRAFYTGGCAGLQL